MKYMILIYGNYDSWNAMTEESLAAIMAVHDGLAAELTASGELIETNELPVQGSRIVRTRGGVQAVTDGPFIELKEIVAGYYLVECASMERATEIAGRIAETEFSLVEVRATTREPSH
jgi:hypothetical protein